MAVLNSERQRKFRVSRDALAKKGLLPGQTMDKLNNLIAAEEARRTEARTVGHPSPSVNLADLIDDLATGSDKTGVAAEARLIALEALGLPNPDIDKYRQTAVEQHVKAKADQAEVERSETAKARARDPRYTRFGF